VHLTLLAIKSQATPHVSAAIHLRNAKAATSLAVEVAVAVALAPALLQVAGVWVLHLRQKPPPVIAIACQST